jgi:anaerobic magnesium-protoporphyrin IX monomethyl ester cyclase
LIIRCKLNEVKSMKIALVGAELEENLGLRYMASSLESKGHQVEIVPFNFETEIDNTVQQVLEYNPQIAGLSMVFTGRGREFCRLADALRAGGYCGHLIAGGPFASFNSDSLLRDFLAFDSIALGEGEALMCSLADHLDDLSQVPGLCYRRSDGSISANPSQRDESELDALPFPKRTAFHAYFGKPIASILTSRGCWRNCAFCSINAWYDRVGGMKFRTRSIENITAEMKELYNKHGVRIFNFQDDNFFLPDKRKALQRFKALQENLEREGIDGIAIAIKARPDSITRESVSVLDQLGLFRVFLGVENASKNGLANLNRKQTVDESLNALEILNDFDVHLAFNLLMFEPDTVMDDILVNLRFIERHLDNPFNFCRAEAHAGTGLETKLKAEGRLLGDYFGLDYRLKDPQCEAFHQVANYAFFDRNFSDFGLHYFNMQVDFTFQLLRRFYPELLSQKLRGAVRSFIKETNLDTFNCLCEIYDFIESTDPKDQMLLRGFALEMRSVVDERSRSLHLAGERILDFLNIAYEYRNLDRTLPLAAASLGRLRPAVPNLAQKDLLSNATNLYGQADLFGQIQTPIPYQTFKMQLSRQSSAGR